MKYRGLIGWIGGLAAGLVILGGGQARACDYTLEFAKLVECRPISQGKVLEMCECDLRLNNGSPTCDPIRLFARSVSVTTSNPIVTCQQADICASLCPRTL